MVGQYGSRELSAYISIYQGLCFRLAQLYAAYGAEDEDEEATDETVMTNKPYTSTVSIHYSNNLLSPSTPRHANTTIYAAYGEEGGVKVV